MRNCVCCLLDHGCDFFGVRCIDGVTCTSDFGRVAVRTHSVPALQVGIDGSVCSGDDHPTWSTSPRRSGDHCFEIVRCVDYLRSRHESGLLRRQIGCKVLMKLRGVEVSETVCRLLYRARLAEITWEAFSVVRLILSSVRHVCNSRAANSEVVPWRL